VFIDSKTAAPNAEARPIGFEPVLTQPHFAIPRGTTIVDSSPSD
jgi:hypothetical protein